MPSETMPFHASAQRVSASARQQPHRHQLKTLAHSLATVPRYGFVLGLDEDGNVIHNLQDPSGDHYAGISSVVRRGNTLYLGSLLEDAVGRLFLP
jgi:hypothetical protein